MGLMTAGKPTTSAALEMSAEDLIRWLAGVGSPARFMHDRVFCAQQGSHAQADGSPHRAAMTAMQDRHMLRSVRGWPEGVTAF